MQKSSTTVYRVLRRSTADVGRNTPLHLRPYIIWILQHPRSCGLQQRTKVCDVVIGGIFLGRLDEDIFSVLCYQFIGREIFLSINSISLSSYIIPSKWHGLNLVITTPRDETEPGADLEFQTTLIIRSVPVICQISTLGKVDLPTDQLHIR
jgi:hypothetical protein